MITPPTPEPVKNVVEPEPVKTVVEPEPVEIVVEKEPEKTPLPAPEAVIEQVIEKPVAEPKPVSEPEKIAVEPENPVEPVQVLDHTPSEVSEHLSEPEDEITDLPKSVSDENLDSNQESPKLQRKIETDAVVEPETPVEPVKDVVEPAVTLDLPVSEPEVSKAPVTAVEPENLPVEEKPTEKFETTLTETIETTIITETTVKSSPIKVTESGDAKPVEKSATKSEEIPKTQILDQNQIEMSSDSDQEKVLDKKSGKILENSC